MTNLKSLRKTSPSKSTAILRLMLAVLFLMTGFMKLLVPMLGEAFLGQLQLAGTPLPELSRWVLPFIEIGIGALLAVGAYTRVAAVGVLGFMFIATYVHLIAEDPNLFPLQPTEPIIPLIAIVMGVYVLWKGGGEWSRDLRRSEQ